MAAGNAVQFREFVERQLLADGCLYHAFARLAQRQRDLPYLAELRQPAWNRSPLIAYMRRRFRSRIAERTGLQSFPHDALHAPDLVRPRRPFGGFRSEGIKAQRRMPQKNGHVDQRTLLFHDIEILGKRLEPPIVAETGLKRLDAHALDILERPQDKAAMLLARRCDAEAAIAHHDRRHTVPRRDRQLPVPKKLRIVMRMDVDDAGSNHLPPGIDSRLRAGGGVSHGHNFAVENTDVSGITRRTGAVHDESARDLQVVVHENALSMNRKTSSPHVRIQSVKRQAYRVPRRCRGISSCVPARSDFSCALPALPATRARSNPNAGNRSPTSGGEHCTYPSS